MATLNRTRPSELLGIDDPYAAWCLDEACLFIVDKARVDKKEPDFDRPARLARQKNEKQETTNAAALSALAAIGVKMNK